MWSSCRKDLEKIHHLQEDYRQGEQSGGNQNFLRDGASTATWTDHGPSAPAFFARGAMPPMLPAYKHATSFGARNSSVS